MLLCMWQDWALSSVQFMLALSLLPTLFHRTQKPTLSSAIMTATCLYAMAAVYFTLAFWFSMTMAATLAAQWTILGIQRYRLNKKSGTSTSL